MEILLGFCGLVGAIFLFVAAIATWVNTGETAKYTKLLWGQVAEAHGLDPKTGKGKA